MTHEGQVAQDSVKSNIQVVILMPLWNYGSRFVKMYHRFVSVLNMENLILAVSEVGK
jgi:hypothetical protein